MHLYDLPPAFAEVEALCADGELDDAALARLTELESVLEKKVDAICRVVRGLEARATAFAAEAERLRSKAAVASNNARRLKQYLQGVLEQLGVQRVEGPLFTVRLQKNPVSVRVAEDIRLDHEFCRITVEVDKAALLEAHKAGRPLPPGVEVVQTVGLRIS